MTITDDRRAILVAGATGYIGARLVPRLLDAGYPVRALARNPAKLADRPWSAHEALEIVRGDLLEPATLAAACRGCRALYYLVHSMNPESGDFARSDREAAANMARAAAAEGVEQIIYLSGLGEEGDDLSEHLRSRAEVAAILRSGTVPVTVLRAAMIIGSGSASFEILRYLVERLPVMITPRWVDTPCQPIGIRNVLTYLVGCLNSPATLGRTFDIGQEEVVSYRRLMEICAEEAGLHKRLILPVPVLTPRLSSYWIHLVTPVPAALARPLAEGLSNTVICRETRIREIIPQDLLDCRQAIRLALEKVRRQEVESTWRDAGIIPPAEWSLSGDPTWAGGTVFEDLWRVTYSGTAEEVWPGVMRIGGATGWYFADWLWWVRGMIDRLLGGIGLQRGRRCPIDLRTGDALDFWRVAAVEKPRSLRLIAEMKVPGEALLEFTLVSRKDHRCELRLRARFLPKGICGILYWYAVAPFHTLIFSGMLRGIGHALALPILEEPKREGKEEDALP